MYVQRSVFDDESAVSPVIGVILMVAVTVIIAAVIGSTALGLGDAVSETPPQAQIEAETLSDYNPDSYNSGDDALITAVELEHTGGEDIEYSNIRVTVNGDPAYSYDTDGDPSGGWTGVVYPWQGTDSISAGDTTTIVMGTTFVEDNDYTLEPVDTQRVLYNWGHESGQSVGAIFQADWDSTPSDDLLEEGDDVRIVWESGDQSQVLLEKEI